MASLGERVRQLRLQHRLSQQEFAQSLGISQGFLSDIERDRKIPGGDTLLSLKRSFDISIDWLLAGELEVYTEGQRAEPHVASPPAATAVEKNRIGLLEKKVKELEDEILRLNGQITAYREIIETLKVR